MNKIIFGSMRMNQEKGDELYWANLLREAYHAGIDTIHSSIEYESFDLLRRSLIKLQEVDNTIVFNHVVKLAEPHFSDSSYSSERLESKINEYLSLLNIESIEAIQWMWRSNLSDSERIERFLAQSEQLKSDLESLKRRNLIKQVYCFPYSVSFMQSSISLDLFDGYCIYRNPCEKDYDEIINKCEPGTVISIRPFNANKELIISRGPIDLLEYNFANPSVGNVILSLSSVQQLNEVKGFLNA